MSLIGKTPTGTAVRWDSCRSTSHEGLSRLCTAVTFMVIGAHTSTQNARGEPDLGMHPRDHGCYWHFGMRHRQWFEVSVSMSFQGPHRFSCAKTKESRRALTLPSKPAACHKSDHVEHIANHAERFEACTRAEDKHLFETTKCPYRDVMLRYDGPKNNITQSTKLTPLSKNWIPGHSLRGLTGNGLFTSPGQEK